MQKQVLIYGKIIVDNIRLRNGEISAGKLGGGGPQAAFGARLWADQVALLTRSGTDLEPVHTQALHDLGLDLSAWLQCPDLPTPRTLLEYDQHEQLHDHGIQTSREDWFALLDRPIILSPQHLQAAGVHLITEFGDEPMVRTALECKQQGMLVSVEPIFDAHSCSDPELLLHFCRQADLVTPDWPNATRIAGSTDPRQVLRFWAKSGPDVIAIRRGAHGSYVWDRFSGNAWYIPPLPITVVDPTGAGNAYGGGYVAGWLQSQDVRLAGCQATVSAALMLGEYGMPRLDLAASQRAHELLDIALSRSVPL